MKMLVKTKSWSRSREQARAEVALPDQVMRLLRDRRDQRRDHLLDPRETLGPLDQRFVHIKPPRDLDLQGMHIVRWPAVMLGDIATGIGIIAAHLESGGGQESLDPLGHLRAARRTVQVAQHEIDRATADAA